MHLIRWISVFTMSIATVYGSQVQAQETDSYDILRYKMSRNWSRKDLNTMVGYIVSNVERLMGA